MSSCVTKSLNPNASDRETAEAFAYSWNTLPEGSVYSEEQVEDWLAPVTPDFISGKRVLEFGCGNGSLLLHIAEWSPREIEGVDLGSSVESARRNLSKLKSCAWKVTQEDLHKWTGEPADFVICIGVIHHLQDPKAGFKAVLNACAKGGRFHCWVYGYEGNGAVRYLVEPLRRLSSKMPRFFTKYFVALPLSIPFFVYANIAKYPVFAFLPLSRYMNWISKREFRFFWHVAFDQLVTPRTVYISKQEIESWLKESEETISLGSTYIIRRNGNSWKFGGTRK